MEATKSQAVYADGMTPGAIARLCSDEAEHRPSNGPLVTIKYGAEGNEAAVVGRIIAETTQEVALLVHGSPLVIPVATIRYRSDIAEAKGCGACGAVEDHAKPSDCDLYDRTPVAVVTFTVRLNIFDQAHLDAALNDTVIVIGENEQHWPYDASVECTDVAILGVKPCRRCDKPIVERDQECEELGTCESL